MEYYKKKSMNFMGYSREIRKLNIENQRKISRSNRLSTVRMGDEDDTNLEDIRITKDSGAGKTGIASKIRPEGEQLRHPHFGAAGHQQGIGGADFPPKEHREGKAAASTGSYRTELQTAGPAQDGKQKDPASARIEMLQKWRQEKIMKKIAESKLKKPVFKVGFLKSSQPPTLGNKPLSVLNTSSKLFTSSFQMTNSQLSSKKQENLNASNTKTNAKMTNSQLSSKKQENLNASNTKTNAKIPNSCLQKAAFSGARSVVPKQIPSGLPKAASSVTRSVLPKQIPSGLPKAASSTTHSVLPKQIPSCLPKAASSATRGVLPKQIPSALPKAPASRTLSTEPKQIKSSLLKAPGTRILTTEHKQIPSSIGKAPASRTLSTEPKQAIPKKNNPVKSLPKCSKTVASEQNGTITPKTNKCVSKEPESDNLPSKEQRKSFAPPDFKFQPPVELDSSLFSEDGPYSIFMRIKSQFLRTSTPKQSPSNRKSTSENEDSKCPENVELFCETEENTQCLKNKETIGNTQCCKNIDNNSGSSHKYDPGDLLSFSLDAVSLNNEKPIDCKQSLEITLDVSTQNPEVILSSKIIHPEPALVAEPAPVGVINPTTWCESNETDKNEINPINSRPADDEKIVVPLAEVDSVLSSAMPDQTFVLKSISKEPTKFVFPSTISKQNQEEVFLPSSNLDSGVSLVKEPEKISDPTFTKQDENAENYPKVPNAFLLKQENGLVKVPERKTRNFKRSEKPGLSSINESLENTPKSALKNKVLDNVFTPRRSLRLAKLSGNFSSLDNLLDSPKQTEKKDNLRVEVTPRRSLRLSKFSSSYENLFDVKRPTFYGTPEKDEVIPKITSRVTYDFDRLSSETEEDIGNRKNFGGKVSLLYTPPNKSRASIMRKSIKGDLINFSPNT